LLARGDMLRDHPAHRRADDMRPPDAEMVEQRHAVRRHVGEAVGAAHRQADRRLDEHPFEVRHAGRGEARRQADIAIVVADGAKAVIVQRRDELVGPERKLSAEPHHQQDRRRPARPLVLISDVDAVDPCLRDRHAAPSFHPCGRSRAPC
jgi:hypothetical protein